MGSSSLSFTFKCEVMFMTCGYRSCNALSSQDGVEFTKRYKFAASALKRSNIMRSYCCFRSSLIEMGCEFRKRASVWATTSSNHGTWYKAILTAADVK